MRHLHAIVVALALEGTAGAEGYSSTNAQLLFGSRFDDRVTGYATRSGRMTTATLEHYATWLYGDNFLFMDLPMGNFVASAGSDAGQDVRTYGEWHPRLSLARMSSRTRGYGVVRDVLVGGQVNLDGNGFWAVLVGPSVELGLPRPHLLGVSVYARDDVVNAPTWQVSPYWSFRFRDGRLGVRLEGFVDLAGTDDKGVDVMFQPQGLVDALSLFNGARDHVYVGIEWYVHRTAVAHTSAPQAMIKWTL